MLVGGGFVSGSPYTLPVVLGGGAPMDPLYPCIYLCLCAASLLGHPIPTRGTPFFFLEVQVHSAQTLSKSGGPAHYTLVTKPMHSGGPEVDAMRRGLDAKGGKVLHVH